MRILLIGCGRTGRVIAEGLLKLKLGIGEILLYSRTPKDAKLLASDLKSSKLKVIEKLKKLPKLDYVIIALSAVSDEARNERMLKRSDTYQVRQDELKFNIGALTDLISYLKSVPKTTTIIVVTNPVYELTNFLRITLNHPKILGFGPELDAARYSKALGKQVFCIGVHGRAVPLISAKSEKKYRDLLKKIDKELLSRIRKHGIPYKIAGKLFSRFFRKLNSKKVETIYASYYLSKEFAGVKDISISLPFKAKKGEIIGVEGLKLNKIEQKMFLKLAVWLRKSVNHI